MKSNVTICTFVLLAGSIGLAAAAPPPPAIRPPQLKSVRLRPSEHSIQVIFTLSAPVRYKLTRTTTGPSRITIDLGSVSISPVFTTRELLTIHAALVRVLITRAGGTTRAVLDLGAAGPHKVYASPGQLIVEIKTRSSAPPARTAAAPLAARSLPNGVVGLPAAEPHAQDFGPVESDATLRIPWVPLGPNIDEFTSSTTPPAGARVSEFRQREPGDGARASQETAAYVSYDNENLYAVFVCHDEPADVRSHLRPRDTIAEDDQVALYLDTFHDGRHAYVFASNPFGVQQDGVISEGDDATVDADMLWRSQGRVTPDGFVVLIAIPFKSLRFSGGSVQSWRIAVSRTIARHGESAFWPYISRGANGFVRQMAALDGLELISPGRNVQLTPYATFARAQSFDRAGGTMAEIRRAGLDAKVVIRNAVTVDAAVRPDFSEVESDDPLVTVNQRFEPFVPEKRPFFMENAALFDTPINVMFSRRITNPDGGVRVTARSTGWTAGGLVANDRGASADSDRLFESGARIGVGRIQRLFGDRSNVGVLATERDDGPARNRVVSADGRLQLTPAWAFAAQAVRSEDQDQGSPRRIGTAFAASVSRAGAHFTSVTGYREAGDDLRVPLGFVPRRDVRAVSQYSGYVWNVGESGDWSLGPALTAVVDWNHAGERQDRWVSADVGVSHAGQLDAHLSRADGYELYLTTPFRTTATDASFTGRAADWLSVWGMYSRGTAINYTPADGVLPFLGEKEAAYASVTLRPSARLDLEQMLMHERLDTMRDPLAASGQMVFSTNLLRSKANLQVTKSLAVRAVLDYSELDSNTALFSESSGSRLMHDLLVRYVLHPGTAVFVGFNRRYESSLADPRSDPRIGPIGLRQFPAGEQIFVKMSYLFRF